MRSKSAVMTFIRFPLKSTLMDRLDWTVHREIIGKREREKRHFPQLAQLMNSRSLKVKNEVKLCTQSHFLVFSANGKITVKSSVIEKPVANHTYLKFIEKYTPFFNQLSICKSVYNHASKMQKGTEGRKV